MKNILLVAFATLISTQITVTGGNPLFEQLQEQINYVDQQRLKIEAELDRARQNKATELAAFLEKRVKQLKAKHVKLQIELSQRRGW